MGKLTELIKFRNDLRYQSHSLRLSTDIQNNINQIDKLFASYDHLNNLTNIEDFKHQTWFMIKYKNKVYKLIEFYTFDNQGQYDILIDLLNEINKVIL
jgi:hypothetical protein